MKVTATYVVDVDVEGWAQAKGITPEVAEAEILRYLGTIDFVGGQTFLALDSATVVEAP